MEIADNLLSDNTIFTAPSRPRQHLLVAGGGTSRGPHRAGSMLRAPSLFLFGSFLHLILS